MEQTVSPARGGWQPEEIDMLWKEIRAASETGTSLRGVFERMGQTLGRKPNSVRNYYYMQLRDQGGEEFHRAAPFETFTEREVHDLLRAVLTARGEGKSVRACVTALSNGDKTLMLRYQNKYRSILRKRPGMIDEVKKELRQEGLPCPEDAYPSARAALPLPEMEDAADPDVRAALEALRSLAGRVSPGAPREQDRWKVQRDLMRMQIEDVQLAAKEMLTVCKDFLGLSEEDRREALPGFCRSLAERAAHLEKACG